MTFAESKKDLEAKPLLWQDVLGDGQLKIKVYFIIYDKKIILF
jgi:hypothetical protein